MICDIENVDARQILDSRGNPTIEVEIELSCGVKTCASVPSGASKGKHEALELRDKDIKLYQGKSVNRAIENVNNIIAPALLGEDASNQRSIDNILLSLDCTFNKSSLGANSMLGVSLACARAAAEAYEMPLYKYLGGINSMTMPVPMMNILNGGKHADNGLDFQEFMIAPVGFSTFSDALRAGAEVFYTLKTILKEKGLSTTVGDEGGFAPNICSTRDALDLVVNAIEKAGYSTNQVKICLDVAASEFYQEGDCCNGVCSLSSYKCNGKEYSTQEMIDYLESLVKEYPIISIEDGLSEDDEFGWIELTKRLGDNCQIVGDDFFVTNLERLRDGINNKRGNSILIKPNQIGTLSETLDTIQFAQRNGYSTIISHRSGETEDTFIADLAVGVNSGLIKTGSLSRTDRICKYNRLLKIEQELGIDAKYLGMDAFSFNK